MSDGTPIDHQVRVMQAWPSGRFVACTCTDQSPASRNEDDLTAWTYAHLGLDPAPLVPSSLAEALTWAAVPDGALF
jgi:hypothetical protein